MSGGVYDWVDPFQAVEIADHLLNRDYDYDREVCEMQNRMRRAYALENAHLRARNEHLMGLISKASALTPLLLPIVLKKET